MFEYYAFHALEVQALLVAAAAAFALFFPDRGSYVKRLKGRTAFSFGQRIKLAISPENPYAGVAVECKQGRFVCLPQDIFMSVRDVEGYSGINATATGYVSGTTASDGTYIPGRTVTVSVPTGKGYFHKVGEEAMFSFKTPEGKSYSVAVPAGKRKRAKFEKMWAEFAGLRDQSLAKVREDLKGI